MNRKITADWLKEKYWEDGLSLTKIGELAEASDSTIHWYMVKFGIPRRGTGKKGALHHNWKGGRPYHAQGYIYILKPGHPNAYNGSSYMLEHRLIMEEILGRYLEPWEIVHHRNGIRDDNRPENLELVTRKNHLGEVKCPHCGGAFKIK